jgi:hypothetical protein
MAGAGGAFVAVGYVVFQLMQAVTGDSEVANLIVVLLAFPLSAPLFAAIDWIDRKL